MQEDGETAVSEEIPSKLIDFLNEEEIMKSIKTERTKTPEATTQFSPIKFVGLNDEIVDEEITISHLARKSLEAECEKTETECVVENEFISSSEIHINSTSTSTRLQRKSDEEICNTPKRERNFEDSNLNIRNRSRNEASEVTESEVNCLIKTPQKIVHLVKSLSMEFEQRLATIHVSPKIQSAATRSMSPVRCIAELSPVSKLNLSEDVIMNNNNNNNKSTFISEPKLVSPSKIVAAASAIEIEKIRIDLESKWAKQVEFLQFEVTSLEEKYDTSVRSNTEMRTMLEEYEKTLAQFIDARRTRPDQHSTHDQLVQEKKKLELEIQTLQISYQNLHQRYEELRGLQEQARINDATLRQSIQLLQQELASTVRNLENTRRIYEDKIEKTNAETRSHKETLEFELSATKAKLLKSELKISSLESAIDAKTKENSELMTICDELIHKMDKRAS